MAIPAIVAGISGLKAAADLTRSIRDGLKSSQIKPDEIAGRIGEIYDYIIDSKAALLDAQEEIQRLHTQIHSFQDDKDFKESLKYDPIGVYRRRLANGEEQIYCSACLDTDNKRVRTMKDMSTRPATLRCDIHGYRQ
ncbi:MAG: hypothetical protein M3O35_05615 [Acidobacteriota bacterium]|nr:hypothetical protein [Acidobacteriota bacterium]